MKYEMSLNAVVPGYYLVCYNAKAIVKPAWLAVVPGYYLVCYNRPDGLHRPSGL